MALPQDPINKFTGHIAAMRSFITYIVTMMETFPTVMTQLQPEQRKAVFEPCVLKWMDFVKELYNRPDLYSDPPRPLPVDPKCSGAAMSDHVKERLGRNHPLFDFINAPFTHPLGTQISLICINYSWDAYATFVSELLSVLKDNCGNDPRVKTLIESERNNSVGQGGFVFCVRQAFGRLLARVIGNELQRAAAGTILSTNEKLRLLQIYAEDQDVAEEVRRHYELQATLKTEQVPKVIQVAKELRTCFAHRFGQPSDKLITIIKSSRFEEFPIRLTSDGYEVTLELSRIIAEIIQVLAHLINHKAEQNYGAFFGGTTE